MLIIPETGILLLLPVLVLAILAFFILVLAFLLASFAEPVVCGDGPKPHAAQMEGLIAAVAQHQLAAAPAHSTRIVIIILLLPGTSPPPQHLGWGTQVKAPIVFLLILIFVLTLVLVVVETDRICLTHTTEATRRSYSHNSTSYLALNYQACLAGLSCMLTRESLCQLFSGSRLEELAQVKELVGEDVQMKCSH